MNRRKFLIGVALATGLRAANQSPRPYGAVPSSRQLRWHELEFYGFLHFTVNTFTDREWGYGDESPSIFNPVAFDAEAIVSGLRVAGMKSVILTAKHHDGFCLWPTRTTEHSIRASSWRQGNGDVVKEIAHAAANQGLKFGVYLSPWDRNNALYGHAEYINIYRQQLRELLTGYGPIAEVWHDGANGGDGFYGGAREKRTIDKTTYYDWPRTWDLVRTLQPDACIFSDVGPDIRWVGNEKGIAGDPCWATYVPVSETGGPASPGDVRAELSTVGTPQGSRWMPAECDVSIRPGWFWHERENAQVKTVSQLKELYFESVGRGASFLLNVPPDRRGLLSDPDVASLRAFGQWHSRTLATNLLQGARIRASNVRGNAEAFRAENLLDGDRATYWTVDDGVTGPSIVVDVPGARMFDVLRLREFLPLGQRVTAVAIDQWASASWLPLASASSVGSCRLIRLPKPVRSPRIRLRFTAQAPPALSEVALFRDAG